MIVKSSEPNFNTENIEMVRIISKIEAKIKEINSYTGYGSLTITINNKKVKNIQHTISEELK
jgi:hypothetical protein